MTNFYILPPKIISTNDFFIFRFVWSYRKQKIRSACIWWCAGINTTFRSWSANHQKFTEYFIVQILSSVQFKNISSEKQTLNKYLVQNDLLRNYKNLKTFLLLKSVVNPCMCTRMDHNKVNFAGLFIFFLQIADII